MLQTIKIIIVDRVSDLKKRENGIGMSKAL